MILIRYVQQIRRPLRWWDFLKIVSQVGHLKYLQKLSMLLTWIMLLLYLRSFMNFRNSRYFYELILHEVFVLKIDLLEKDVFLIYIFNFWQTIYWKSTTFFRITAQLLQKPIEFSQWEFSRSIIPFNWTASLRNKRRLSMYRCCFESEINQFLRRCSGITDYPHPKGTFF